MTNESGLESVCWNEKSDDHISSQSVRPDSSYRVIHDIQMEIRIVQKKQKHGDDSKMNI
jgi:hypothetical protein